MIQNIKSQKLNDIRLVEILFYAFPLCFIIGNLAVSLNTLLFIIVSLFVIKKEGLNFRFKNSYWLLIIFFLYFFISTTIQFQNNVDNFNALVEVKKLTDPPPLYDTTLWGRFAYDNKIQNWPLESHPIFKSFLLIRFLILILVVDTLFFNKILNLKKFFLISLLCTTFVSLDIILQYIIGFDLFGFKSLAASNSGPFGDESIAGGYLQRLSFLSIFYIFVIFKNKNFNKPLLIFIITSHAIAILLSGNRMPMLLFLLGCFLIILLVKNFRFLMSASLVIFLTISLVIVTNDKNFRLKKWAAVYGPLLVYVNQMYYNSDISKINLDEKDKSTTEYKKSLERKKYREKMWMDWKRGFIVEERPLNLLRHTAHDRVYRTAVAMWQEQPLFGFGLKSFRIKCWKLSYRDGSRACSTHAHNYYLELLSEAGLIGTSLMIIFFLILFKDSFYFLIKHHQTIKPEKLLLIPIIIVFFLEIWPIRSAGSFFTTGNATLFWLNTAILLSAIKKNVKL